MKVLLTGATGFVGRAVASRLRAAGVAVRTSSRSNDWSHPGEHVITDLEKPSRLDSLTDGCDAVIHLAARTHRTASRQDDAKQYRASNVEATARLLDASLRTGVRRFVFISSIKVNGESTEGRAAFTANDPPDPQDWYAATKCEAEDLVRDATRTTGMDHVVVRPPLVYGPGVLANLAALVRAIERRVPLPLASIENARSFVSVQNLADLITTATASEAASSRTLLVSDGQDLSTPQLVHKISSAIGIRPWLMPCPPAVLRAIGRATGRSAMFERLCGSLQVDISATTGALGWIPPLTVDQSMALMAGPPDHR
jgi:nucleoside-diphosphate-sugar epimerase